MDYIGKINTFNHTINLKYLINKDDEILFCHRYFRGMYQIM